MSNVDYNRPGADTPELSAQGCISRSVESQIVSLSIFYFTTKVAGCVRLFHSDYFYKQLEAELNFVSRQTRQSRKPSPTNMRVGKRKPRLLLTPRCSGNPLQLRPYQTSARSLPPKTGRSWLIVARLFWPTQSPSLERMRITQSACGSASGRYRCIWKPCKA